MTVIGSILRASSYARRDSLTRVMGTLRAPDGALVPPLLWVPDWPEEAALEMGFGSAVTGGDAVGVVLFGAKSIEMADANIVLGFCGRLVSRSP